MFFDDSLRQSLIGLVVVLNSISFFLMGWDKLRSREKDAQRIPESLFMTLSVLGGAVGVWIGMFMFRHKTRTWYFYLGVSLIVLQHIALLLIYQKYN